MTMHGDPYADEAPEDSIIFDLAVLDVNSDLQIKDFIPQVGIWSNPLTRRWSKMVMATQPTASPILRPVIRSIVPVLNTTVGRGSGRQQRAAGFSRRGSSGLRSPDPEDGIAWGPRARQIALIYQKDLWIVDLKTGQAVQITSDGQASRPRWSRSR